MSRTNYYNKIRSAPKEFPIPLDEIQSVSDTFLQFCLEHGLPETSREIDGIKGSVAALREGDFAKAGKYHRQLRWGKEGFNEWPPKVVYPHESPRYVCTIFITLFQRWSRLVGDVITKGLEWKKMRDAQAFLK